MCLITGIEYTSFKFPIFPFLLLCGVSSWSISLCYDLVKKNYSPETEYNQFFMTILSLILTVLLLCNFIITLQIWFLETRKTYYMQLVKSSEEDAEVPTAIIVT